MPSARPAASLGVSSLDMAAALMMVQQIPGSPISPSASGSPSAWNTVQPPPLQLPGSRLKSSLSARDLDYDIDPMGFEGYPKMLLDEISGCSSPRSTWKVNDLFASMDPSVLSRIQGAPLKHLPGTAGGGLQINQSLSQQLLSGYGGNLPSSPTMNTSSSFGLDHSMATPVMNPRQAAFSKRSQSFVDRGPIARHPPGRLSPPSDWGSPDGKLDWGIQGDELNKLKKSATFNSRINGSNNNGFKLPPLEEPDLSWVQHLVKDGPASPGPETGRLGLDPNQQKLNLSWDHLYAEQEKMQLVA
ncbi:hypothetical protein HPP92_024832 [Vanilla planifolia]|nr:hypothetical protein HPP92_024832 [Vanilla planifolia]